MADDEDKPEVIITGRDVYSGAAGFAPFDLGGMASAISAYYEQMAAAAASAYVPPPLPPAPQPPLSPEDVPEVVVEAPRPRPPAAAPPQPPPLVGFLPSPGFVPAPAPLPEVIVEAPRTPSRAPAGAPLRLPLGPLVIAGLVIPFLELLGRVDEAATRRSGERLGLPPRRPPRTTAPGETTPDPFRYGRPRPWGISGPPLPAGERRPSTANPPRGSTASPDSRVAPELLPEVTVTGRAPRVLPSPAPWWFPSPLPGADPDFSPFPIAPEAPAPTRRPLDVPFAIPLPGIVEVPDVGPFPEVAPAPRTPTRPATPLPPTVLDPGSPTLPGGDIAIGPQPFTPLRPPTTADPCNCAEKTKKRGKKKPRTVCYQGTYTEKATGLSKRRRVRVDCRTGKEIGGAEPSPPPKKRKTKSPNPPPPSWEIPPP